MSAGKSSFGLYPDKTKFNLERPVLEKRSAFPVSFRWDFFRKAVDETVIVKKAHGTVTYVKSIHQATGFQLRKEKDDYLSVLFTFGI